MGDSIQLSEQHRQIIEEFRSKHKTGILTLLFTDMVDSVKMKTELGETVGNALIEQQKKVVRDILSGFIEAEENKHCWGFVFYCFHPSV